MDTDKLTDVNELFDSITDKIDGLMEKIEPLVEIRQQLFALNDNLKQSRSILMHIKHGRSNVVHRAGVKIKTEVIEDI